MDTLEADRDRFAYTISRYAWIPIPHIRWYRLWGKGESHPLYLQLGLTIPACTIPLTISIIGWGMLKGQWPAAAALMAGYATGLSLPVFIITVMGMHPMVRAVLSPAARTPWITAIGLAVAAGYYWHF